MSGIISIFSSLVRMAESALASAAGGERENHFLCLIRDFAAEKSHGEWRVSDLERRLDDLRAAASDLKRRLDDLRAAAELHATKRAEEAAEVEMSGSQERAAIVAASIQAFEATNSHLYEEISKTGSDLEALKSKRDSARDEFISQMHELKAKIRQFQQMVSLELAEEKFFGLPSAGEHVREKDKIESEGILKGLVDKVSSVDAEVHVLEEEYHKELLDHDKELANIQGSFIESVMGDSESCCRDKIISQIHEMNSKIRQFQQMVSLELAEEKCSGLPSAEGQHVGDEDEIMEMEGILKILADTVSKINAEVHVLEGECKKDLLDHDKVCEDLADIQAKRALMEAVMGEMKHLQELRQQTADMEKVYASHGKGLQRRHTCPSCGINNMVGLEGVGLHPKSSSSSMKEHDSSTSHLTICRDVVGKRGGSEDFGFLVSMGKHGSSSDSDTGDDYDSSDSSSPVVISRRRFYFPPPRSTAAAALPHRTPWQQHFSTALPGCSSPSKELPPLPPLPQFEVTQVQDSLSSGSSDDTSEVVSTSSSCKSGGDIENLEDLYAFGQPAWESLVAPVMGLALDEEEEELMMEATVLLGSDHKARKIIAEFDDAESSLAQVQAILGQQEVAIRTLPTSRDFLLNLPLSFLCKEKKGINCPICKSGFISKKRCARLPCSHFFHVHCILEWLLRANTCPACRCAFPSTDNNG